MMETDGRVPYTGDGKRGRSCDRIFDSAIFFYLSLPSFPSGLVGHITCLRTRTPATRGNSGWNSSTSPRDRSARVDVHLLLRPLA